MADYTHVNLKDVEDSATKFGFAPNMEARFASGALDLERSGLSYQRLAPNFRGPFGHRHEEQEEIYVILSGSGRVAIGDEEVGVKALDAVRVPPDTTRCFESGPDGLELLAFGAPRNAATASADVEMVPEWWGD